MRYSEISEGIRMGGRELSQPTSGNYTIGFEFEVAVESGFAADDDYSDLNSDSDDAYSEAYDDFSERWYRGESTFDFESWFNDYLRYYTGGILKFIEKSGYEPRSGWVEDVEDYIKFLNAEQKRSYENTLRDFSPDVIERAKEFYREIESDPVGYSKDKTKLLELFQFMYGNIYSNTRYLEAEYVNKQIKAALETKSEEEIQKTFDYAFNKLKYSFVGPYEYSVEDEEVKEFDPDDQLYLYDEYKNVVNIEDAVTDLDELLQYFDVELDQLRDDLSDEASEADREAMESAFSDWWNSNGSSTTSGSKLNYVRKRVRDSIGNWTVKEDGTMGVDGEFISPVIPSLERGIRIMRKVFDFIQNDEYIYTSSACGLHINIGTWKANEYRSVDWLKFLVVYRASRVLEEFGRTYNTYAPDKLREIIRGLEGENLGPLYDNIDAINNIAIKISQKYSSINLSKLPSIGIIELRAPGNRDYETKGDYLEREIRRIGRALDIASDPQAYRSEYAKKLYVLFSKYGAASDVTGVDPVDTFFKRVSGNTVGEYTFLSALQKILTIIKNRDKFNISVANNNYTAAVHNGIMPDLREFAKINSSGPAEIIEIIERYLREYDPDNIVRNTRFIKSILRTLGK